MARILALSSQVAHGHVGLSAITPALQAFGHEVTALPTILLSNHLGHPISAGQPIEPQRLSDIVDALDGNGWIGGIEGVLIAYLPTIAHVTFVNDLLARLTAAGSKAPVVLDPILGDDPDGLYIDTEVARAIKTQLVPLADILTPNRFELSWLADLPVTGCSSAQTAAEKLVSNAASVVATSVPSSAQEDGLATFVWAAGQAKFAEQQRLQGVPHGTGDVLAALVTGFVADGVPLADAVAKGLGVLAALILRSVGQDDLALMPTEAWSQAKALTLHQL